MAEHVFVFIEETAQDHIFECSKCGTKIGFNKPGIGWPCADLSGSTPVPPYDVHAYIEPCAEIS